MIENKDEKKKICRDILSALPCWFGIPEAIDNYVNKSSEMPFWVVCYNDVLVGFISLKTTSVDTAEIYVLGVLPEYHHKGFGRELFRVTYEWCRQNNFAFLQVKTLDRSHPDEGYAITRRFYEAMGFKELECIPEIWGKDNPCLIMIMSVN